MASTLAAVSNGPYIFYVRLVSDIPDQETRLLYQSPNHLSQCRHLRDQLPPVIFKSLLLGASHCFHPPEVPFPHPRPHPLLPPPLAATAHAARHGPGAVDPNRHGHHDSMECINQDPRRRRQKQRDRQQYESEIKTQRSLRHICTWARRSASSGSLVVPQETCEELASLRPLGTVGCGLVGVEREQQKSTGAENTEYSQGCVDPVDSHVCVFFLGGGWRWPCAGRRRRLRLADCWLFASVTKRDYRINVQLVVWVCL